ncbi:MAG: MerR family transcriptional regulator [Sphingobacteriales bacterium]|nr:MAG: MerR family transcriptional regulator [Sphingobacteriales bacterium]
MALYSIKDIENLSGIKAHTLRIWEQRYNLFKPYRTDTNIRFYTDNELKLILNVVLLSKMGYRIGKIARMSSDDIKKSITHLSKSELKYDTLINELTEAMIDVDEDRFENIISASISQLGLFKTMLRVVYPFLEKIGMMWLTSIITPAQEHFITNLIRQKIIVAIDGQVTKADKDSKHYLLFLPEGELHEISLLFLYYLLKCKNHKITYLGMSVPLADVVEVFKLKQPDGIYTIFTSLPTDDELGAYLGKLSSSFDNSPVFVSGMRLEGYKELPPKNVRLLHKLEEVLELFQISE